jgi:hypothetical protein
MDNTGTESETAVCSLYSSAVILLAYFIRGSRSAI